MQTINLTHGFYNNGTAFTPENYLHKYAKQVVLNWFNDENDPEYTHSFKNLNNGKPFRPNRTCGVWVDYPIVIDKKYNSVETNWDELHYWEDEMYNKNRQYEYDIQLNDEEKEDEEYIMSYLKSRFHYDIVPTIEDCKLLNVKILKLMDLVISHKGKPVLFIHIYDKKRMSNYEIKELKNYDIENLIEINVRWIMSQTNKPDLLKYFQLIA